MITEETKERIRESISSEVSSSDIKKIAKMTSKNDHFGVRIFIAKKLLNDPILAQFYTSLEWAHQNFHTSKIKMSFPHVRDSVESELIIRMKKKISNWKAVHDAL